MIDNALVITAILAHFLGDFVFQTNKIAALKAKSTKGVAVHCSVVAVIHFVLLFPFGLTGILLTPALLTVHFFTDILKLKLGKIRIPTTYFFIDQFLHLGSTILITSHVKASSPWITLTTIQYFKAAILFIIAVYVSTIVIKQLYFSFGALSFTQTTFFEPKERGLDLLFNTLLLILFYFRPHFLIVYILCAVGIYYCLHTLSVRYATRLLNIKILFYALWTAACTFIYLLL